MIVTNNIKHKRIMCNPSIEDYSTFFREGGWVKIDRSERTIENETKYFFRFFLKIITLLQMYIAKDRPNGLR